MNKSVIVTGASGGIGSAVALKFAENGWNVGVTYNKNSVGILQSQIEKLGVKFFAVQMELSCKKSVKNAIEKILDFFGSVDCVVCNAGVNENEKLLIDVCDDELDFLVDSNLKGTILCNKIASDHFISKRKGSIVNISSVYGIFGGSCEVVYSTCKAGIIGLTKALSREIGQFGVRVNCVAPGLIETNMTKNLSQSEKEEIVKNASISRVGRGKDVANAVCFLADDSSSYITGEILSVSGGLLL